MGYNNQDTYLHRRRRPYEISYDPKVQNEQEGLRSGIDKQKKVRIDEKLPTASIFIKVLEHHCQIYSNPRRRQPQIQRRINTRISPLPCIRDWLLDIAAARRLPLGVGNELRKLSPHVSLPLRKSRPRTRKIKQPT